MPDAPDRYTTLASASRFEPDKIKGSRFIAFVAPARDENQAQAFVESVREEFSDARHVCFAWRLGSAGDLARSSDDGEPSGSAGRPILLQIEGHGITDAVACVVRYFGGVKLGVGGLMRAYGGAAGAALDRAALRHVDVRVALRCRHPYGDSGAVSAVLAAHALEPRDAEYAEDVAFTIDVPKRTVQRVETELRDATGARLTVAPDEGLGH